MASRRVEDLSEPVRYMAMKFIAECKRNGLEVLIYCTLRSNAEQAALYKIGRGVAGAIVTYAKAGQSKHNPDKNGKAWAFDAVPVKNGVAMWSDLRSIKKMGAIGESVGLKWSGLWTRNPEYVHFELEQKMIDD